MQEWGRRWEAGVTPRRPLTQPDRGPVHQDAHRGRVCEDVGAEGAVAPDPGEPAQRPEEVGSGPYPPTHAPTHAPTYPSSNPRLAQDADDPCTSQVAPSAATPYLTMAACGLEQVAPSGSPSPALPAPLSSTGRVHLHLEPLCPDPGLLPPPSPPHLGGHPSDLCFPLPPGPRPSWPRRQTPCGGRS